MVQPNYQRVDLLDAVDLILDFNETIQLDLKTKNKNNINTYCDKCKKEKKNTENIDPKMFRIKNNRFYNDDYDDYDDCYDDFYYYYDDFN